MAAGPLLVGVDLGTGGPTVALVSAGGHVIGLERAPVQTRHLPGSGAEQDPEDWWQAIRDCTARLLAGQPGAAGQVAAICFSGQCSGTVPVDERGRVTHPALIRMDGRGARYAAQVTGGLVSVPGMGYSARKLRAWVAKTGGAPTRSGQDPVGQSLWLARERPDAFAAAHWLLDIPEYLTFRASGSAVAAADTAVLRWCTDNRDPQRIHWDYQLAEMAQLDPRKLPQIVSPATVVGTLTPQAAVDLRLPATVKVVSGTSDMAAAAIGAGTVADLVPYLYVGTSAWLSCHVQRKKTDVFRNIASMPSVVPGRYWVATVRNGAGKAIDWLIENVLHQAGPARSAAALAELEALAATAPPGSSGLIFSPWLNGARMVDDATIPGNWLNLSQASGRQDLTRAVFEGIAYDTRRMLEAVEHFTGRTDSGGLGPIRFIGGGASSRLWCQTMADILDRPIDQIEQPAAARARGAALLAGVALGQVSWGDIPALARSTERFDPDPAHRTVYEEGYGAFRAHYKRNRSVNARLSGRVAGLPTCLRRTFHGRGASTGLISPVLGARHP
jgi:xylulokinase